MYFSSAINPQPSEEALQKNVTKNNPLKIMFGVIISKKIVVTTAVISMFRCAPGTDILIAAEKERRVEGSAITRAMYNVGYKHVGTANEALAQSFLNANSASLHINDVNTELSAKEIQRTERGSHIRYEQSYQGILVHRGELIISTTASNEVGMVINNFKNDIRLSVPSRTIGAQSAVAAVRATLPATARLIGKNGEPVLMVWQDEQREYHITYRVRMTTENPLGDWEAFVDAKSGAVLHIENRFANSGTHEQGSGYVYLTDPLSAAKKRYGATGFTDNNDSDSDSLSFYRTRVTLDSLTLENGAYKLKGPYCEVADIESPADPEYFSSDKNGFNFTRSQQEFEAVNVYYHISKSYQYIQSLGFTSPSLAAVRLDPHGLNGVDNSHYSPSQNYIAWGEGGIDDAEDVDAILHEYGHAIVFNFCPSWGGGESGSLGEGYSDYWAVSNSRSTKGWTPSCYEYNWVYNWNAHNMFQLGRSVNDSRTYPFTGNDVHDNGQIWSSTLMAIWNELGKEVTDKLVLKSLHYLGSSATGTDAAQALIQADRDLFGGAHVATLVYWLGTVKRFIEPSNSLPTISHTPLNDMALDNWHPIVRASVSQNRPVEAVWVEYKINEGFLRSFPLAPIGDDAYEAEFIINPSTLQANDSISYKIFARYVGDGQIVAVNPIVGFYRFRVLGRSLAVGDRKEPTEFALMQNYPNPFNPTTNISYTLPEPSEVTLKIYSIAGEEVATILSGSQNAGSFTTTWTAQNDNGSQVSSGTYIYRLEALTPNGKQFALQSKMILVR